MYVALHIIRASMTLLAELIHFRHTYTHTLVNMLHWQVPQRQPKYQYTPSDYLTCTVITALVCGLFSPLTLMFTIPAFVFAQKVRVSFFSPTLDTNSRYQHKYEQEDSSSHDNECMKACLLCVVSFYPLILVCYSQSLPFPLYISSRVEHHARWEISSWLENKE